MICLPSRSVSDAIRLLGEFTQLSVLRKAVFQVASEGASLNRASNGLPYLFRAFAVPALDIDGHRQICCSPLIVSTSASNPASATLSVAAYRAPIRHTLDPTAHTTTNAEAP